MTLIKRCKAVSAQKVFSHYAYGDPLPVYARYVSENGAVPIDDPDAITVWVRCQREAGHTGMHLATADGANWVDPEPEGA